MLEIDILKDYLLNNLGVQLVDFFEGLGMTPTRPAG